MTKEFTKEKINNLASTLLFAVSDDEVEIVLDELEFLKSKMDNISHIKNIMDYEIQTHPFDLYETSLREDDSSEEGTDVNLLLANAKNTQNREIEVPKVVG
ncbi:MAG: hypothetical protein PHG03_05105 [Bacilli bacterium]|nr:hypothetical protein [Bacilli bacterium]MDD4795913.1 hypothetical protein [Bacilli bacterium]